MHSLCKLLNPAQHFSLSFEVEREDLPRLDEFLIDLLEKSQGKMKDGMNLG